MPRIKNSTHEALVHFGSLTLAKPLTVEIREMDGLMFEDSQLYKGGPFVIVLPAPFSFEAAGSTLEEAKKVAGDAILRYHPRFRASVQALQTLLHDLSDYLTDDERTKVDPDVATEMDRRAKLRPLWLGGDTWFTADVLDRMVKNHE